MDVRVGDTIQTKKPHPCGANTFEVLRVGMDFRIRCTGCGHEAVSYTHLMADGVVSMLARAAVRIPDG